MRDPELKYGMSVTGLVDPKTLEGEQLTMKQAIEGTECLDVLAAGASLPCVTRRTVRLAWIADRPIPSRTMAEPEPSATPELAPEATPTPKVKAKKPPKKPPKKVPGPSAPPAPAPSE